jgi:hypothetical protein
MCFCLSWGSTNLFAQTGKIDAAESMRRSREEDRRIEQQKRDSTQEAQQAELQARRDAMQKSLDSMREARAKIFDSIQEVRARRADSMQAIREYKESRYYKDSVKYAREARLKAIQETRARITDSIKTIRKKSIDSVIASRKKTMDSIKGIQKRRSDSLTAKRKYKESKRYADSVVVVKKLKTDSTMRKRKARADSLLVRRKKTTDSIARIRKVRTDSLVVKRKVKTDSLVKRKEKSEKLQKDRLDAREKKQQLAFELKIKKKHKEYSNEKMLKKRWSLPRQFVQNNFTRYNYYYNINRKMEEAMQNMQRARKDNYDSLLALYPFNPDRDSALLANDMDSLIQKASVGIQIHDPRTKWGDDLYLLLGQAYFYKGNYNEASASFRYVLSLRDKKNKDYLKNNSSTGNTKKQLSIAQADKKGMLDFLKHRSVHNEAILWLAHTYTQMKQEGNAESVLDLVAADPNFPDNLKGKLALEKAFIALHEKDLKTAADQLAIVMKDDNIPDWQRMRAAYIAGQIYQDRSEYEASAKSFQQVIDLHPKLDMDFYARKNMAFSQMNTNVGQEEALASFKKVLNDSKYITYYEQVYYILGRLSANTGNTDNALAYFRKGLASAKVTPKQKALTFAAIGNVYYDKNKYIEAKLAYDSAAILASHAPKDSSVKLAVKRSQKLSGITEPMRVIHEDDSLIALSKMSNKEQLSVVRKYIKRLETERNDSAFKAENAALNASKQSSSKANPNNPYSNWYFANSALVQQGINEFKRKWGSRQPIDNWARMSAISSFTNKDNAEDNKSSESDEVDVVYDANGLPTEESLLAFIPNTDERKAELIGNIQQAYMDLATSYINDFEEYGLALQTLDTFDKRYPTTEYEAEALYLHYLAYMKQGKIENAQVYAKKVAEKYADGKYADLVGHGATESSLTTNAGLAQYYDETYDLLLNRDNFSVLARLKQAKQQFSDANYAKRFWIMEGIAMAGIDSFTYADSLVRDFIGKYPKDSLRPWADAVLKYIADKKPKPVAASPLAGSPTTASPTSGTNPPAPPPLPNSPTAGTAPAEKVIFNYNASEPHFALFTFSGMEPRTTAMRAAIADFNTSRFAMLNLSAEIALLDGTSGVIVTKSFANSTEAKIYLNLLNGNTQAFKDYKPGEYQLLMISSSNYDKLMKSKDMNQYLIFYKANYK